MSGFYKVIEIPDETRVIINYGIKNNLLDLDANIEGKKIQIVEKGIELIDPDSKEKIGFYNLIKETLVITEAFHSFSVARKEIIENSPSPFVRAVSPMLSHQQKIYYQKLNISDKENKKLTLKNKQIQIGDLVEII